MKYTRTAMRIPFGLPFFVVLALVGSPEGYAMAGETKKDGIAQQMAKLQMPFISNRGQTDERVKFYARTFGGAVFVTVDGEIVYSLPEVKGEVEVKCRLTRQASGQPLERGVALKETLRGGKIEKITGEGGSIARVHYFKGSDPSRWRSNIPTYDLVSLGEVYEGIKLKLKAHGNNIEKLFYVRPGANPEKIKVRLSGAKGLKVSESGELEVKTDLGVVRFTKPIAYQEEKAASSLGEAGKGKGVRRYVDVTYVFRGDEYGFKIGDYDRTKELIIDPLLASTFLGGSGDDYAGSIAIDSAGNVIAIDSSGHVYVGGDTFSSDFPTTPGAYNTVSHGGWDAFVSKLDSDLTILLASTYLGGDGDDSARSIAIDSSGHVYVGGDTSSSDFPTTEAYDTTFNGQYDAFVSKLDSDLTTLLASTYLGGDGYDSVRSIAIDSDGNIYMSGETRSLDFPTTEEAYDTSFNGQYDAFVSRLNGDLTTLLASTYLGGDGYDSACSIVIDSAGDVYTGGFTNSIDFPTTPGAYDATFNDDDDHDAFVSKLDSDLTTLHASTYLGGQSWDSARSIAISLSGDVYVGGYTKSSNFPTTPGAYDTTFNGQYDAFISRLNGDLTALHASTFLGGSGNDLGRFVAIDLSGTVYVGGETFSLDFPTTPEAYDITFNGQCDAFVSKLDSDLTILHASTYLGGSGNDYARSIAVDSGGNVYISGETYSSDFPTTPEAYDTTFNGQYDAFMSRLDSNLSADVQAPPENNPPSQPELIFPDNGQGGLGATVTFRWKKSTDPDGDPIREELCLRADDPDFTETDCTPIEEAAALVDQGVLYAGIGVSGAGLLIFGMVLVTGMRGRRRIAFLIALLLATGMMLDSCVGGETPSADEVRHAVSGLEGDTTYYWKVVADDGNGDPAESEVRSFTTQ